MQAPVRYCSASCDNLEENRRSELDCNFVPRVGTQHDASDRRTLRKITRAFYIVSLNATIHDICQYAVNRL
jgi:hypothetical protein